MNERAFPPLPMPQALSGAGEFLWATGIEDTFIPQPHATTGRILDEYALTEHYQRWEEDLGLISQLGVSCVRYGIPWHRVNPVSNGFDWEWTDRALDRLVNVHKIEPIIDLVHYGAPLWLSDSFANPDYPRYVADYARAFAERYRGLCYWYTPLNEPRVHAWYAGRLGWWPPYGKSERSFVAVLTQLCRGICLTQRAIRETEPDARFVHVDATDLYLPHDPLDPLLAAIASQRQEIVFLALDLAMGRVGDDHPLRSWLMQTGVDDAALQWFRQNAVQPDVIGYNMYPMFSRKIVGRATNGGIRVKIRPCGAATLSELTRLYARRYHPLPLMITETASSGAMTRRIKWIEESVAAVRLARAEGLPVIGYTFWPLFSLVTWAYRNGKSDRDAYLLDMGLWDLQPGPSGLARVSTPAVEAYKQAIARGID